MNNQFLPRKNRKFGHFFSTEFKMKENFNFSCLIFQLLFFDYFWFFPPKCVNSDIFEIQNGGKMKFFYLICNSIFILSLIVDWFQFFPPKNGKVGHFLFQRSSRWRKSSSFYLIYHLIFNLMHNLILLKFNFLIILHFPAKKNLDILFHKKSKWRKT